MSVDEPEAPEVAEKPESNDVAIVPAPVPASAPAPTPAAATPAPAPAPAPQVEVPAAPVAVVPEAPAPPAPVTLAGQGEQVLALSGSQYTVQLLGAASRANVEAFVQRNADAPLYWFESENQGQPWYVVIHGSYASRAAAQSAANGLAGELGRLQPWIRSLSAVQRDIDPSD